jgi:hypothetical protein
MVTPKQLANLKKIKKGEVRNPGGRPKGDPILDKLKKLTVEELEELVNVLIKGNIGELRRISKDENTSVIKAMVTAVAIKIISRGDMASLDKLLDRLVGKIKERVEHSGTINGGSAPQVIITLPSNGRETKLD